MAAVAEQNQKQEKSSRNLLSEPVSVHVVSIQDNFCFSLPVVIQTTPSLFICTLSRPILDKVIPPPKLSLYAS
jgi:hypothetical protein